MPRAFCDGPVALENPFSGSECISRPISDSGRLDATSTERRVEKPMLLQCIRLFEPGGEEIQIQWNRQSHSRHPQESSPYAAYSLGGAHQCNADAYFKPTSTPLRSFSRYDIIVYYEALVLSSQN